VPQSRLRKRPLTLDDGDEEIGVGEYEQDEEHLDSDKCYRPPSGTMPTVGHVQHRPA
jgi:hypothetical protein